VDDIIDELCSLFCPSLKEGLVLDPFGEFVNSDVDLVETSWCRLEWPNHIQSLACERPGSRNRV
jgi:hypothetical protein